LALAVVSSERRMTNEHKAQAVLAIALSIRWPLELRRLLLTALTRAYEHGYDACEADYLNEFQTEATDGTGESSCSD
jgi:hypothetical protein